MRFVSFFSSDLFSGYPEWAQYSNVHIERTPRRVGVATAKAFGANYALASDKPAELNQHLLVFLDSHSIVSENWLVPLIATVQTHPNAGKETVVFVWNGYELKGVKYCSGVPCH